TSPAQGSRLAAILLGLAGVRRAPGRGAMDAQCHEREECASPCTCASGEASEAPLLAEPCRPSPWSLPAADAAALEEGRHGAPLRACGLEGDGLRRGAFAAAGILSVIGLVLLGAAAWSPAGFPDRTSELSQHDSPDVIGLNVIGVRPTTPAPRAELPPQAPLRPPPDFPIQPPPGFYPDLPGASEDVDEEEEEEAPPRPPLLDLPIEPPPGFYPEGSGAAEDWDAQPKQIYTMCAPRPQGRRRRRRGPRRTSPSSRRRASTTRTSPSSRPQASTRTSGRHASRRRAARARRPRGPRAGTRCCGRGGSAQRARPPRGSRPRAVRRRAGSSRRCPRTCQSPLARPRRGRVTPRARWARWSLCRGWPGQRQPGESRTCERRTLRCCRDASLGRLLEKAHAVRASRRRSLLGARLRYYSVCPTSWIQLTDLNTRGMQLNDVLPYQKYGQGVR
ncbi:unnamed protein product, partial [Prorocentrum cordatum]